MALGAALLSGCGTTKWSDTGRTATEQLLISTAVDKAINEINFEPLAGKSVFFDSQYVQGVTDEHYVVGSLLQQMLSHGCALKETRDQADYIVVARAGAVGTNRHDVMVGVPSINLPVVGAMAGVPSSIPEIPFAKTTEQQGVAKIALFAYNRKSGRAVWQSGVFPVASYAKDSWILGAGPFQRGSIYDGTRFAGSRLIKPFRAKPDEASNKPKIPITAEVVFEEPASLAESSAPAEGQTQIPAAESPAEAPAATATDEGGEFDAAPAAHLLRLPRLDQAERPDLTPGPIPTEDDNGEPGLFDAEVFDEGNRLGGSSEESIEDEGADTSDDRGGQAGAQGFDLFDPGTWF